MQRAGGNRTQPEPEAAPSPMRSPARRRLHTRNRSRARLADSARTAGAGSPLQWDAFAGKAGHSRRPPISGMQAQARGTVIHAQLANTRPLIARTVSPRSCLRGHLSLTAFVAAVVRSEQRLAGRNIVASQVLGGESDRGGTALRAPAHGVARLCFRDGMPDPEPDLYAKRAD